MVGCRDTRLSPAVPCVRIPIKFRLLALDALQFVRQMAFWESFYTTSADLPTAGCSADDEQWASIRTPAIVTGGADPMHPTIAAQRIHKLLCNSSYHDPVVSLEEWDKVPEVRMRASSFKQKMR